MKAKERRKEIYERSKGIQKGIKDGGSKMGKEREKTEGKKMNKGGRK
jgi:hypothetical protein